VSAEQPPPSQFPALAAMDGGRKAGESFEQESGNISLAPGAGGGGAVPQASFGNVSLSSTAGGSAASMAAPSAPPPGPQQPTFTGPNTAGASNFQAAAQASMQQAAAGAVQEVATSAVQNAGRVLRRGASEIRVYVQANPYSVTMLSFIGGCWLIFSSMLTILNIFGALAPLNYILQFYQVFFGLLIVVVDGPADKLPQVMRAKILSYASFLHNNISRVLFYLFIACQQGTQIGWSNFIAGWYFLGIAVGYGALQVAAPPQQLPPPATAGSEGPTTSFTSAAH